MSTPEPLPLPENPTPYWGSSEAEVTYRRPMTDTGGYSFGIAVVVLFFVVAPIWIAVSDTKESRQKRLLIGIIGGSLGLGVTASLVYAMRVTARRTLRADADGVHVITPVRSSSISYREVESLTFWCGETFDDTAAVMAGLVGVAVGGVLGAPMTASTAATSGALAGMQSGTGDSGWYRVAMRIEGAARQRLEFDCKYRGSLSSLVSVRDAIARRIAVQWWEWFGAGEPIEWCNGVEFTAEGLSWTAGWWRQAGTVRYEEVLVLTFDARVVHLHKASGIPQFLSIRLDRKNSYPGLVLLNRIREARGSL